MAIVLERCLERRLGILLCFHVTAMGKYLFIGPAALSVCLVACGGDATVRLDDDAAWRSDLSAVYQRSSGSTADYTLFWATDDQSAFRFFPGSAGIYTTPTEYAKFLRLWLDNGQVGGRQFIRQDLIEQAMVVEPLSAAGPTTYGTTPYGLHWDMGPGILRPAVGIDSFGHPGAFGTIGWIVPEKELIILYFTQSFGGRTHFQFVEEAIARLAS